MNSQEFHIAITPMLNAIFEAHGKSAPSDAVLGLWFGAVEKFDAVAVLWAINEYVGRPAPSFGMVMPNDIVLLIQGSPEERAGLAWQKFLTAARRKSPYLSVVFDDPYIHATVTFMGGWAKLTGELGDDNREQSRRSFESNYKLFLLGGLPADTPLRLPGMVENHRILNGLKYDEPTQLVGDRSAAHLVATGRHPALPARLEALAAPPAN